MLSIAGKLQQKTKLKYTSTNIQNNHEKICTNYYRGLKSGIDFVSSVYSISSANFLMCSLITDPKLYYIAL